MNHANAEVKAINLNVRKKKGKASEEMLKEQKQKQKAFDIAEKAFDEEHRKVYKSHIRKAEKSRDTEKAIKLRQQYKDGFGEELPATLPDEEDKPKKD